MRNRCIPVWTGLALIALGGCASAPPPPAVDFSARRPANTERAVALQACQFELHNTRLQAEGCERQVGNARTALAQMNLRQQVLSDLQQRSGPLANKVHTLYFALGSSRPEMTDAVRQTLIDEANRSPLVVIRGRIDGQRNSLSESALARSRAEAVRDMLIAGGVHPARIRSTYQPIGDHAAENRTPDGRALNRRAEIEFYRALPVELLLDETVKPQDHRLPTAPGGDHGR